MCVRGGGGFAYILFLTSGARYKIDDPGGFAVDVVIDAVLFVRGSTGESVPLLSYIYKLCTFWLRT